MDDGDFVLNIAPADASIRTVSRREGGKWKDRLKAKRTAQFRSGKPIPSTTQTSTAPRPDDAIVKKRRLESKESSNNSTSKVTARTGPVISSLFTYNPEIPKAANSTTASADTTPSNAPVADSSTFIGLGLDPTLVDHLQKKLHVETPTAVQQKSIPAILGSARRVKGQPPISDADVFVQAQTGSGKTLAFLLPILNRLYTAVDRDPGRNVGTLAIILTPTRELSRQIHDVLNTLLSVPASIVRPHWIVPGFVMGGDKKKSEKARLRKGVHILVSTPGRLLDHLQNSRAFEVSNLRWLVLDEADRLMDLGFEDTLREIIEILNKKSRPVDGRHILDRSTVLPRRRITILCSATLREDVERLAGQALNKPLIVKGDDKPKEDNFQAPKQLKQRYCIVPAKLRLVAMAALLRHLVSAQPASKAIVFFSCTDAVEFYHALFTQPEKNEKLDEGIGSSEDEEPKRPVTSPISAPSSYFGSSNPIFKLHGNLAQDMRTSTFYSFSKMQSGAVLFCTDVAARGLDLPDVNLIVQYDAPGTIKDYLHRIGRTARLGKEGEAMLMLLPSEAGYINALKDVGDLQERSVETILGEGFQAQRKGTYEMKATEMQLSFERWVLASEQHLSLARKAFKSHIRAYATHTAVEKQYFHIRLLHLGHMAKSFALRDAPTDISSSKAKSTAAKEDNATRQKQKQRATIRKRQQDNITGEFADSATTGPVRKRKISHNFVV